MIEVEDRDPSSPSNICVRESGVEDNVYVSQSGAVQIHKDTWPALKEAIETTFKQMEAKPFIRKEDRTAVYLILCDTLPTGTPTEALLDALERGYA